MTICEYRPRWRHFDTKFEAFLAPSAEYPQFMDRCREESKRRYEALTYQWLELAEQRQRCA
jgi:hypothetical protein